MNELEALLEASVANRDLVQYLSTALVHSRLELEAVLEAGRGAEKMASAYHQRLTRPAVPVGLPGLSLIALIAAALAGGAL